MPEPEAPFWRTKSMTEMTRARVGEPVRRLRALLPQQADRRATPARPCTPTSAAGCSTTRPAAARDYAHRQAPGEGLRAADLAQRVAAVLAAADLRLPDRGEGPGPGLVAPAGLRHPETVHEAGVSVRGRVAANEKDVPDDGWRTISWRGRGSGRRRAREANACQGEVRAQIVAGVYEKQENHDCRRAFPPVSEGFCFAFNAVGIRTKWANDFDPYACQVYRAISLRTRLIERDVRKLSVKRDKLPLVDYFAC